MRIAAGLFRLWVVLSVPWLAVAAAYIVVSYQSAPEHDLTRGLIFDDLVPAYEHCWKSSDGKKVNANDRISIEDLTQIAECERVVDRRVILRDDILTALAIPFAILVVGWGLVWAFRGFLPARSP
jgi:hypothetical protein